MKTRRNVIIAICALLMLLFMYTAASKFLYIPGFRRDMLNQPFPNWLGKIFVWSIPTVELLICLVLFFDKTRLIGLISSMILMLAFTIYTAAILLRFFKWVPCSCGGIIRELTWKQHLVFNLFFLFSAILGIILQVKEKKLRRQFSSDHILFDTYSQSVYK